MNTEALKEMLYKMADDQLIIGHRNSEWTGFGPLLEEDIAFSSMAQDKVGQSYALYQMLNELGEGEPDTVAFMRNADQFHNCTLTELPNGEYDFSLIRHFLFDAAEAIRFDMLTRSSYKPLADLSIKIRGEIRYHTMHARTWIRQLGNATPESVERLQNSLNEALPHALGIFEPSPFEDEIISSGLFEGERALQAAWEIEIMKVLSETVLQVPDLTALSPSYGGRIGKHTPHLQPLLDEMAEVFRSDPTADW
ncbi:1,2-phenylacetyl-CoA epoxidase subunit PaaC [Fulvivirga sedimenti]|uniref:Phenylacetate-CoA oxygenase subunit PaaC n=1 Tax=Fulvivirga sedimenti TaxID=2879465 RepID=A0A9X1L037_9BACT|nr:1,2-phenylacetyl-CoA epoxidase subunit PaaC [Fulvivirga sedimenti]MCA6075234.1 phenylacetate-CoA oxygenase subunit PaaC [Fulvivirga sedimenti]MCA6076411.1 phenylacetate-CoA oxygenase subunit PaaC [Fulvivirga sedimenti]MCA6077539.1 phenylacetate-CoA oxygenase subunit PaaC [Fulvivirga sedimenti]